MRQSRSVVFAAASLTLVLSSASAGSAYERPGTTVRATVATDGSEADPLLDAECALGYPARSRFDVSADGRFVVFGSDAGNLAPDDRNGVCDVFVRDLKKNETSRVSVTSSGLEAIGACPPGLMKGSGSPAVSRTGRFVAFASCATNLVPGDTNLSMDVFVYDRSKGVTERVSVDSEGSDLPSPQDLPGSTSSHSPSISDDGRYVSFVGPPGTEGFYIRDRGIGKTELIEQPSTAGYASLSSTGRFLVYEDSALLGERGVWVHDRKTGKDELVNLASDGTASTSNVPGLSSDRIWNAGGRSISADGRFVVFTSPARNLVPSDSNTRDDVYVRDRATGRTERVSVTSSGEERDLAGAFPAISANGRFVTFAWNASANSFYDFIVYDRETGQSISIARDDRGRTPGCSRSQPEPHFVLAGAISASGQKAAYMWDCDQSVQGDRNGAADVFVRDIGGSLGVGSLAGEWAQGDLSADDRICVTPDICIPPGVAVSSSDDLNDVSEALTRQGANIYGASLAYRPLHQELFATIELEHMPQVSRGVSPISYGLRFTVGDKHYEVRASSLDLGTFELFDCTRPQHLCSSVTELRGGYGTTGTRVVFSLPLDAVGLSPGTEISDVEAFSGIGVYPGGASKLLDRVAFD